MANWFASLFFAVLAFSLSCLAGKEIGLETGVWVTAGLVLWLTAGLLLSGPSQFGDDVCEVTEKAESLEVKNPSPSTDDHLSNEQSLHAAVIELTRQLRSKEVSIDKLQAKLTEREFRRSLSRLATISETLSFTLKLLQDGKLTHADAVDQLRQEIEAAVGDLGLEHHCIQVGAAVATLPPGSFVILKSENTAEANAAGTVKEVVSTGLFAKDEDGKPHFISPSKINVYKL
jgi:hypothetical protein